MAIKDPFLRALPSGDFEITQLEATSREALKVLLAVETLRSSIDKRKRESRGNVQKGLDAASYDIALDELAQFANDLARDAGRAYEEFGEKPRTVTRIEETFDAAGLKPRSSAVALTFAFLKLPGVRSTHEALLGLRPVNGDLAIAYDAVLTAIDEGTAGAALRPEAQMALTGVGSERTGQKSGTMDVCSK